MSLLFSMLLTACGPKEPVKPAVPEEVKSVETAPEEVPVEPEPEPEPEPLESNISFNAKLTYADGTIREGRIIRVERSGKFNAFDGEWKEETKRLKMDLQKGETYQTVAWTDIKSIAIKPNSKKLECIYESEYTPWLYVCVMTTSSSATTKDGKRWSVDNKYKWKFYFADESSAEFWIQDHRRLEQDTEEVNLNSSIPENRNLYKKLQEQLRSDSKGAMIIRIDVD